MAPLKNTRLAWGIALASLALWATTAPIAWGQVLAGANRIVSDTLITPSDDTAVDDDTSAQSVPCVAPLPTQVAVAPLPALATSGSAPSGDTLNSGSFHICGPDQAAAQSIEQLIGGRSFSASLSARGDGCADLTIQVTSQTVGGSASSHLVVSLGSGKALDLTIASGGGATHVSIGAGQ